MPLSLLVNLKNSANKTGAKNCDEDIQFIRNEIEKLNELKKKILIKAKKINPDDLYFDLSNFFADSHFVKDFCDNFLDLVKTGIKNI